MSNRGNSNGRGPGADDPANHDANDDHGGVNSLPGADDPADHDANDHRGGDGNHGDNGNNGDNQGPGHDHGGPPVVMADTLTGTDGADRLKGGDGDDSIAGLGGNDRLEGDKGADTIDGGAGDDFIRGGQGPDVLTGGDGHDTFRIDSGAKTLGDLDRITDFTHGQDHFVFDDEGPVATAANFATDTAVDFTTALADANAKMAAGADFVAVQVGADVIVFADQVNEHHVESGVLLVGRSLTDVAFSDIG